MSRPSLVTAGQSEACQSKRKHPDRGFVFGHDQCSISISFSEKGCVVSPATIDSCSPFDPLPRVETTSFRPRSSTFAKSRRRLKRCVADPLIMEDVAGIDRDRAVSIATRRQCECYRSRYTVNTIDKRLSWPR
ncbi:hypothetical protein J6590_034228 [Homalodisca vitripennis]|nr:hypothetical protein J6590_034228 [Homalodisca vitripennis]